MGTKRPFGRGLAAARRLTNPSRPGAVAVRGVVGGNLVDGGRARLAVGDPDDGDVGGQPGQDLVRAGGIHEDDGAVDRVLEDERRGRHLVVHLLEEDAEPGLARTPADAGEHRAHDGQFEPAEVVPDRQHGQLTGRGLGGARTAAGPAAEFRRRVADRLHGRADLVDGLGAHVGQFVEDAGDRRGRNAGDLGNWNDRHARSLIRPRKGGSCRGR